MKRNLLLSGGPTHDFDATSRSIATLLAEAGFETSLVTEPDAMLNTLRSAEGGGPPYDLLTINALRWRMEDRRDPRDRARYGFALSRSDAALIKRFVESGGGLLALHSAVICFDAEPTWHALCGASWNWDASSHPPRADARITVTDAGRAHCITRGTDDFTVVDEVYSFLDEDPDIVPLLTSEYEGRAQPLLWARAAGAGRVVTDLLGHDLASVEHPVHRTILRRAAIWATQEKQA